MSSVLKNLIFLQLKYDWNIFLQLLHIVLFLVSPEQPSTFNVEWQYSSTSCRYVTNEHVVCIP